jgi:SlyX protein
VSQELLSRIEELEVRVAFQDDLLGTLNTGVSDMSTEIRRLREELKRLRDGFESLRAAASHDPQQEPPPPHY